MVPPPSQVAGDIPTKVSEGGSGHEDGKHGGGGPTEALEETPKNQDPPKAATPEELFTGSQGQPVDSPASPVPSNENETWNDSTKAFSVLEPVFLKKTVWILEFLGYNSNRVSHEPLRRNGTYRSSSNKRQSNKTNKKNQKLLMCCHRWHCQNQLKTKGFVG